MRVVLRKIKLSDRVRVGQRIFIIVTTVVVTLKLPKFDVSITPFTYAAHELGNRSKPAFFLNYEINEPYSRPPQRYCHETYLRYLATEPENEGNCNKTLEANHPLLGANNKIN